MGKNTELVRQDEGNKMMALLAYLGILVVIPFLTEKKLDFVRFHVGQGINLFVAEILYSILYQILASVLMMISWQLYTIVRILGYTAFVFPVLAVIGIVNVVNGQKKELPVIGQIRLIK